MFGFNKGGGPLPAELMGGRGGRGGPFPGGRGGFGGPGGGGGFGGPGGFDEFGRGRGGGRLGRLFAGGDLKLLVLSLIEQQPRHGYDVIRHIEEMFDGQYSPSPGAIYPTLMLLEEQGYVSVNAADGGKKLYTITQAGAESLAQQQNALTELTQRLQVIARSLSTQSVPEEVRMAARTIKHELIAHHRAWDNAETQRVVELLGKAADAIAERKAR